MPRSKNNVKRPPVDIQALARAIAEVKKGTTFNAAAEGNGIARRTLQRHYKNTSPSKEFKYENKCAHKKIFTEQQENDLVDYLLLCSKLMHGLTRKVLAKFAYDFAKRNGKSVPESWEENGKAGRRWLNDFIKRHNRLTLRTPQPRSIGRATCFNKPVVESYFLDLSALFDKYEFHPGDMYNVDESGLSTVQAPPKVIAEKGARTVGAISLAERGRTVTLIATINALGNTIPPLLVFPMVRFQDTMLFGAPPGTIGVANPSGWSNSSIFMDYMKHLVRQARPSKEKPILLLLDNHESHLSVDVIDFAKQHGVVLFTFPPHTTHKLQPLDRGVFGPFKKHFNHQLTLWMQNNPGKPVTIHHIAMILGASYPMGFTAGNIQGSFRGSGIYPINPYVFTEADFLPSAITGRPTPSSSSSMASESAADPSVATIQSNYQQINKVADSQYMPGVRILE